MGTRCRGIQREGLEVFGNTTGCGHGRRTEGRTGNLAGLLDPLGIAIETSSGIVKGFEAQAERRGIGLQTKIARLRVFKQGIGDDRKPVMAFGLPFRQTAPREI